MDHKYDVLMQFLLTELSQPTLRAVRAAADKRFQAIYEMVMRNPEARTGTIEGVLEDFLCQVTDYLDDSPPLTTRTKHHQNHKTMTLQEAINKFVEYRAIRSERSAHSYRIALNHLTRWLDGSITDADELTSQHLREFAVWLANEYRTKYGKKLATVSLELYLVATLQFYGYLLTEGHNSTNFVATREWIKKLTRGRERPPIEKRLPPPEAVKLLLQAVDRPPEIPEDIKPSMKQRKRLVWLRNRAVVYCLESSGARVGEIAGLKWGDLVTEDKGAWVMGKGQKERFIRFSPAAWKRLNEYLVARGSALIPQAPLFIRHDRGIGNRIAPISTLTIERTINRLASQSGILETFNLTPHSLRHHFATRFLSHTKNLALTQDVLGHKSPDTTRIYAKTSREDHIRAHQELFD